jgi:hypothetical protein
MWEPVKTFFSSLSKFMADIVSPIVIASATVAILRVSSGQWTAFREQVTEMQKALLATNKLVEATNVQARGVVASQSPLVTVQTVRLYEVPPKDSKTTLGQEITEGVMPKESILSIFVFNGEKGPARVN